MFSRSERHITLGGLVGEAGRVAVATPVGSALIGLIVAAVCATAIATTGQTVRAESDVLSRIDQLGTRVVAAFDDQGTAAIDPASVERIGSLSTVDWVMGVGFAHDGRNANIGPAATPVPIRTYYGELPDIVHLDGRQPRPGEVIVGDQAAATLGLILPVGGVDIDATEASIVGGFHADDPLGDLNHTMLAAPNANNEKTLRALYVLADNPADVATLTGAVAALLGAKQPAAVRYETSETLAELRAAVAGELGRYSRRLVVAALAVGLVLVAIVVYSTVTLRRQDFGRRRALGATRLYRRRPGDLDQPHGRDCRHHHRRLPRHCRRRPRHGGPTGLAIYHSRCHADPPDHAGRLAPPSPHRRRPRPCPCPTCSLMLIPAPRCRLVYSSPVGGNNVPALSEDLGPLDWKPTPFWTPLFWLGRQEQ